MDAVETYTVGENKVLQIFIDEIPSNPRQDSDCFSRMVCFHGRYSLGDEHKYRSQDYAGWTELKVQIKKDYDVAIILPLYLYDHSGITISTQPFSCPWDSGQVGWIFVTKQDIRENYLRKNITKRLLQQATELILAELNEYDQYIRGEVYGYKLMEGEEEIDSCWGFFGNDLEKNGILDNLEEDVRQAVLKQLH